MRGVGAPCGSEEGAWWAASSPPGSERAAASIAHMHLCVCVCACVYTPMPCLLRPTRPHVLIATGRLIVHLSNCLWPGSCWAGSLFPSLQPPIALRVPEMLSAGMPAPNTAAGEGPLVGCTQHQAVPGPALLLPPESEAAPACMLSAGVLLSGTGPQPLRPCVSLWLLYPGPSRLPPPHQRAPGPGERSCHGTFLQLQRNPGGERKKPSKKQTHCHEGSES